VPLATREDVRHAPGRRARPPAGSRGPSHGRDVPVEAGDQAYEQLLAEPADDGTLDLGTARFTLTLSPGHYRRFSGEGALLGSLADDDVTADAELMSVLLAWSPRIDVGRISAEAGLSPERTVLALTRLAASGRVGYDLAEQSFFHRELPFGPALEKLHPRLADARALIASGAVTPHDGGASVRGGDAEHRVTFATPHDVCACPWRGRHRGTPARRDLRRNQ